MDLHFLGRCDVYRWRVVCVDVCVYIVLTFHPSSLTAQLCLHIASVCISDKLMFVPLLCRLQEKCAGFLRADHDSYSLSSIIQS